MAISGAFLVDRIGRRPLLLFTNFTLGLVWLGMAIASSIHSQTGSVDSARAILALIYMFKIVFSLGVTPVIVLYPVEVLSFEMRAKGFAFSGLVVNLAGLLNQFAWPVAFASIRWKTYVILMFWCFFQGLVIYILIPETRGRTVSCFSMKSRIMEADRMFTTSSRNSTTSSRQRILAKNRSGRRNLNPVKRRLRLCVKVFHRSYFQIKGLDSIFAIRNSILSSIRLFNITCRAVIELDFMDIGK